MHVLYVPSPDPNARRPFIRFGRPTPTPSTDEVLRLHIERRSHDRASGPYPGDRRRPRPPAVHAAPPGHHSVGDAGP